MEQKKVYRRMYRACCGYECVLTTRIKDIFRFVARYLLADVDRSFVRIEFEVITISK